jgi:histidyl-tRNA synthetase
LVGIFGKKPINCIGISFGVDRIFTILKARQGVEEQIKTETEVYVMSFGNGLLLERMEIVSELWDGGIRAEFMPKVKPRLPQQFKSAENVPLAVILGQDELAAGKFRCTCFGPLISYEADFCPVSGQVRLKVLGLDADHPEKEGVLVKKVDIVAEVQEKLSKLRST